MEKRDKKKNKTKLYEKQRSRLVFNRQSKRAITVENLLNLVNQPDRHTGQTRTDMGMGASDAFVRVGWKSYAKLLIHFTSHSVWVCGFYQTGHTPDMHMCSP